MWPESELLPMDLEAGREMSLFEMKIKLPGKRCTSKQEFHEIYPSLPTQAAQGNYSKSQNCGVRTDIKTRDLNLLRTVESFEEQKASTESDASYLPNRAKVLPQRIDNV